jgi:hypothetical protein
LTGLLAAGPCSLASRTTTPLTTTGDTIMVSRGPECRRVFQRDSSSCGKRGKHFGKSGVVVPTKSSNFCCHRLAKYLETQTLKRSGLPNSKSTGSTVNLSTYHEVNFRRLCTNFANDLPLLRCVQIPIVRLLTSSRTRRRNAIARMPAQRYFSASGNVGGGKRKAPSGVARDHVESEKRANVHLQAVSLGKEIPYGIERWRFTFDFDRIFSPATLADKFVEIQHAVDLTQPASA